MGAPRTERIGIDPLRRFVVARQGYTAKRRATPDDVADVIRGLQAVQLDSISAVERAHRLTIGSRVGTFGRDVENQLLAAGRIFEYWAHEACLLAVEDFPMMRRRMVERDAREHWGSSTPRDRGLEEAVLERIRDEGPLPARAFEGSNRAEMWGWKPAKRALEHLFASGHLTTARRDGFQRIYDLTERVIPAEYRDAPVPSESEFVREYAARAIDARGALTAQGIVEHCRLKGRQAQVAEQLAALVADGRVRQLAVEDGGRDVFVPAGVEIDGEPTGSVLLCPFENILWDRRLAPRLFGFEHIIEVYKPEPIRQFGYYVLPLLVRDRIVARLDLRRNRAADTIDVRAVHREPGQRATKALDKAIRSALARVASSAGVSAPQWPPTSPD